MRHSSISRRYRRLFISDQVQDRWVVVDEALLECLFQRLPRRSDGRMVRSLDFSRLPDVQHLPPNLHCDQINLSGTAIQTLPRELEVMDFLDLHDCKRLTRLPPGLKVNRLDLSGCTALATLPDGMQVQHLSLRGCTALTTLPRRLACSDLDLEATNLRSLPADLRITCRLNLVGCRELMALPTGLRTQILVLRGCTALTSLPPGLDVFDLDIQGCTELSLWQEPGMAHHGRVLAAGCRKLTALPRQLTELEILDVRDCASLAELPRGLRVRQWIDVAGTRLSELPASTRKAKLRWHGVEIDERIAFHPERLTADEVLRERNVERRRIMMERFGMERLMQQSRAQVLDRDMDRGGPRELLSVPVSNEEALTCVSVQCPSTGRRYWLRVPPTMRSCRQAVAWTAGFDDPDHYQPLEET